MKLRKRRPKVTGDSYRDCKKYLEIKKKNNQSSNLTTPTIGNISIKNSKINSNDSSNTNNIL